MEKNVTGRDFVVGDIHGCYELLIDKLSYIGFDRTKDRLFSVGDLIDRGPESEKCIRLLSEPWFFMVLGNHEEMMINAFTGSGPSYGWLSEYGSWTNRITRDELDKIVEDLQSLPFCMTIEMEGFSAGICHAETPGFDWMEAAETDARNPRMVWGRRVLNGNEKGHVSGIDISLHGHTPLDVPKWVDNRYFLDTGAWYSDELTVRKIDDIWSEYCQMRCL